MFRKPREAADSSLQSEPLAVLPLVGRPPTPPHAASGPRVHSVTPKTMTSPAIATTPTLGRANISAKKGSASASRGKSAANGSILSFFKKDGSVRSGSNDDLFFGSYAEVDLPEVPTQIPTPPKDNSGDPEQRAQPVTVRADADDRYQERDQPVKRQRTSATEFRVLAASQGPFLDDSDDEFPASVQQSEAIAVQEASMELSPEVETSKEPVPATDAEQTLQLHHETTSIGPEETEAFEEDYIEDEFAAEGEEYLERQWQETQARLELEIGEDGIDPDEIQDDSIQEEQLEECFQVQAPSAISNCPSCGGNTSGLSEQQVAVHVNDCLDGKAKPLGGAGADKPPSESSTNAANQQPNGAKRFQRAAIARPGQENPFTLDANSEKPSSAFSKLMSGHAEDTAWAAAAASEMASRGKPAYQRTCPFYKILPGFFICVDAFRYGAVQGCNAYFLSHFHSDHYIGLTSSWCHGPIYCSRVTGNLMRRQLRIDPKYVVDLEFEQKVEVPHTQGVFVTMIPANHCPGSSLFLFEKVVGRGPKPKMQRVLHCGDFRASPEHVQHPKLRPEGIDPMTGEKFQQKLDVCYLDTTYLTPKYAFPTQEQVITACGQMCISLSKQFVDTSDGWETAKRERAGKGMVKFMHQASMKSETGDDDAVSKLAVKDEPEDETLKNQEASAEETASASALDVKIKAEEDEAAELSENVKRDKADMKPTRPAKARGRLLVVIGTYSIGKERMCLGVARALNSKIYAPPNKQKVVAALEDPELSALMTTDPYDAQVHMQMLMEIRAETLADYLTEFKPHFARVVGFRPTGWNYRPPHSRFIESPSVQTVLYSDNWRSRFSMSELVPQRGSTRESNCFGVPYSEHSSFRELTMFCCALRIDKIIPTVNIGSAKSRERMKSWIEKWAMERKKNGLFKVKEGSKAWT